MKRSYSESEPEENDGFEHDSRNYDGGDLDARARKKRRGQIEKKRRDRINDSLAELRQLVPAAIQRQGSAKLEKAEILQLTVEHLRGLKYGSESNKGLTVTCGSEIHTAGFQECVAEVSRRISAVESPDTNVQPTPIRSEIINHLDFWAPKNCGEIKPFEIPVPLQSSPTAKETLHLPLSGSSIKHEITQEIHSLLGGKDGQHEMHNWGLSFALNYPAIFPLNLRAQGTTETFHSSFAHKTVPLMDWSRALVAKANITSPHLHPWTPSTLCSQGQKIAFLK